MGSSDKLEQELDAEALMNAARRAAGLSDFGDPAFVEPLRRFLAASRTEIAFTTQGLEGFKQDVMRILTNRLRMQNDFIEHPEIEAEDVSDPIVILGVVRSGTTKLQRMMAADPRLQSIPLWQILFPSPLPGTRAGQSPDPRLELLLSAGGGYASGDIAESVQAAHAMIPDAPDEDILLFENTFQHLYLYLRNPIHSYWEWVKTQSARVPYEFYRRLLKYIQWQHGGKQGRPFVLKCTTHMGELELLLELFPNATIVHCHRDPYECIPSYSRLQELMWSLRGEPVPPKIVGRAMLDAYGGAMRRCIQSRDKLGDRLRIIDVSYRDIKDDPIPRIREIYQVAGRALEAQAEQRMLLWEDENQQHRFGKHVYTAEHFELTRAQIQAAFGDYTQRFTQYL